MIVVGFVETYLGHGAAQWRNGSGWGFMHDGRTATLDNNRVPKELWLIRAGNTDLRWWHWQKHPSAT